MAFDEYKVGDKARLVYFKGKPIGLVVGKLTGPGGISYRVNASTAWGWFRASELEPVKPTEEAS